MPPRLRSFLAQAAAFALAAGLLWLALRGVDLGAVSQALREADYRWAGPLVAVLFGSHFLRAWRWKLLLDGLDGAPRVPLMTAFGAVLVSYMVNYAAPRLGEVARVAVVARRTGVPASSVLGTVVLDRLLDVGMLALSLLTVPLLLGDRLDAFLGLTRNPLAGRGPLVAGLAVAALAGLVLAWRARRRLAATRAGRRLAPLLAGFAEGLRTLRTAPRRGLLVGLTLAMWGLYVLLAYLPFRMLHLAEPHGLSLVDGWCIMLIGALGLVVPSPGGAGSYHYITIETLTRLYGLDRADAATYAVLAHGAQLVLYVASGAAALAAFALVRPKPSGAASAAQTPADRSTRHLDGSPTPADGSAREASAG